MSNTANDGTLVRGSITTTINSVAYTWLDYSRTGGAARIEKDYDASGLPAAWSVAEDFEELSGTIRVRSDKATPPKFIVFSYDSKNWAIIERVESGSTEGLKQYAVTAMEVVNGSVTVA